MGQNRRSPQTVLMWRPVLLFGGGLLLAIFEAVQPFLGHQVEWAIVSLAATMMGLEMFQQSRDGEHSAAPRPPAAPPPPAPPPDREDPPDPPVPGVLAARAAPAAPATLALLADRQAAPRLTLRVAV
jgi:hypothetical protein